MSTETTAPMPSAIQIDSNGASTVTQTQNDMKLTRPRSA